MNRLQKMIVEKRGNTPVLGIGLYRYDPVFVEMAAHMGFDVLWIEMEHTPTTFEQAGNLCRIASGLGLLTMIRISDSTRENVLKAAECGPDIIDLPMANSPAVLKEFVNHARYAPEGERGFFWASRAVRYGVAASIPAEQARVNEDLCLMGQIETRRAVECVDELVSVPGVDAFFVGPGDLSASLGVVGETDNPIVQVAMSKAIAAAKSCGKQVAMAINPNEAGRWVREGVDLLFCGSDIGCQRTGCQGVMDAATRAIAGAQAGDSEIVRALR